MEIEATHTHPSTLDNRVVAAASVVVALVSMAFANFAASGDGGAGPFLVTSAFSLIVTAVVYGRAIPRADERGTQKRTARVLAGLCVLGTWLFWSGLTQVAAPAVAVLATSAAGERRPAYTGALAIAAVTYLVALVACVIG
jgi:hypothetical protein